MSRMQDLYTGSAGQAVVMSEFLVRGYNVAVPEVDRGDDLFVVRDKEGDFHRVQVKTATARPLARGGYSAQFSVPLDQLSSPQTPELSYVLAVRHGNRWQDFVVIPRGVLYAQHTTNNKVGTLTSKGKHRLVLYVSFSDTHITCSKQSFEAYRNDFSKWPRIQH